MLKYEISSAYSNGLMIHQDHVREKSLWGLNEDDLGTQEPGSAGWQVARRLMPRVPPSRGVTSRACGRGQGVIPRFRLPGSGSNKAVLRGALSLRVALCLRVRPRNLASASKRTGYKPSG